VVSKTDTWMPLYIGDYLADTMHLNAQEHGAYLLLLMHYWRNGPLMNDDKVLAGIARVDRKVWDRGVGATVRVFFVHENNRLHQKRMDAERERAGAISSKRKAAADARWHANGQQEASNGNANAYANAFQKDTHVRTCAPASPSQSQLQKEITPPSPSEMSPPSSVARRGSRLPEDWGPSDEERQFAFELGLNPRATAAQFADYWHAKAGKDAAKLDWSATWRGWCRRDAERRKPTGQPKFRNGFAQIAHELAEEERAKRDATPFLDWENPNVH
jgi:uncharacterized protein YdaU (DUF1376 family)